MNVDSVSPLVPPRAAASEQLSRVVAAARECFRERGVAKTRMGHIAERAGIVRQTVYDFVTNRAEIVDLAIEVRIGELATQIMAAPPPGDDLDERLEELFVRIIEVVGTDPEYAMLAGALGERHAFQFLAGPSRLTPLAAAVFTPLFEEARRHGRLRSNVPEDLLVEWAQGILALLSARDGIAPDHLRTLLRTFALPAILTPA